MIPEKLLDYVKVYHNFISEDLCKKSVNQLQELESEKHSFYQSKDGSLESHSEDLSVIYADFDGKQEIDTRLWYAIEKYVLHDFESFSQWFCGWNGYTEIRVNRYDPSTRMKLHCDHIHSMFDGQRKGVPVLTILGTLNNDYEGGDLMLFGDHKIDLPAGSVIVFPSNFMYPHEVKLVKSGVRYSYVSWVW